MPNIQYLIIYSSCSPAWSDPNNVHYVIYVFTVGFLVPNLIITCTSIDLVQVHKKVSFVLFKKYFALQRINYFHGSSVNTNEYFIMIQQSIKSTGRIAKMVAARQKRLTRMVTIMIAAFNLAWTPYAFVAILKVLQRNFFPVTWTVPGLLLCKTYVKLVDILESLHT